MIELDMDGPKVWAKGAAGDAMDYRRALQHALSENKATKGEKTRLSIKIAACTLLEEYSLSVLRVRDLCERIGIAQGTFYIYFRDRNDLVDGLLEGFVDFVAESMIAHAREGEDDPVRASTEAYCLIFERNAGLMKCLLSYYEEFPEARSIAQKMNATWINTVVRAARRKLKSEGRADAVDDDELYRRAYALGGMVDQYLAYLFLYGDRNVIRVSRDRASVVDTLTRIWQRSMAD